MCQVEEAEHTRLEKRIKALDKKRERAGVDGGHASRAAAPLSPGHGSEPALSTLEKKGKR